MRKKITAEQEARDMLERMGVENAQSFSSGDLVELANLIAGVDAKCPRCGAPITCTSCGLGVGT